MALAWLCGPLCCTLNINAHQRPFRFQGHEMKPTFQTHPSSNNNGTSVVSRTSRPIIYLVASFLPPPTSLVLPTEDMNQEAESQLVCQLQFSFGKNVCDPHEPVLHTSLLCTVCGERSLYCRCGLSIPCSRRLLRASTFLSLLHASDNSRGYSLTQAGGQGRAKSTA